MKEDTIVSPRLKPIIEANHEEAAILEGDHYSMLTNLSSEASSPTISTTSQHLDDPTSLVLPKSTSTHATNNNGNHNNRIRTASAYSSLSTQSACYPNNIERMFETFHQSPHGDFKPTFYNPFEIKHRRRTTKSQFKTLECSFQENSKPNAAVRRALATKLGMTPRAVQVWFQNRRAKMKTQQGDKLSVMLMINDARSDAPGPTSDEDTSNEANEKTISGCSTTSLPGDRDSDALIVPASPSINCLGTSSSLLLSSASITPTETPSPHVPNAQNSQWNGNASANNINTITNANNGERIDKNRSTECINIHHSSINGIKGIKGISRRHSMPNMDMGPTSMNSVNIQLPFKQLHEAIFGPNSTATHPNSMSIRPIGMMMPPKLVVSSPFPHPQQQHVYGYPPIQHGYYQNYGIPQKSMQRKGSFSNSSVSASTNMNSGYISNNSTISGSGGYNFGNNNHLFNPNLNQTVVSDSSSPCYSSGLLQNNSNQTSQSASGKVSGNLYDPMISAGMLTNLGGSSGGGGGNGGGGCINNGGGSITDGNILGHGGGLIYTGGNAGACTGNILGNNRGGASTPIDLDLFLQSIIAAPSTPVISNGSNPPTNSNSTNSCQYSESSSTAIPQQHSTIYQSSNRRDHIGYHQTQPSKPHLHHSLATHVPPSPPPLASINPQHLYSQYANTHLANVFAGLVSGDASSMTGMSDTLASILYGTVNPANNSTTNANGNSGNESSLLLDSNPHGVVGMHNTNHEINNDFQFEIGGSHSSNTTGDPATYLMSAYVEDGRFVEN